MPVTGSKDVRAREAAADIPVFLSCPTSLSKEQEWSRNFILRQLKRHKLEPRALGRSDYPTTDQKVRGSSPFGRATVARRGIVTA